MPIYSFFGYAATNITVSGTRTVDNMVVDKTLSGLNQGDGSHLLNETITITDTTQTEFIVDDRGNSEDTFFADNDGSQRLEADVEVGGDSFSAGSRIEAEYQFQVMDSDGNIYTAIAVNIVEAGGPNTFGTIEAITFVGGAPPPNEPLTVLNPGEGPGNSSSNGIAATELGVCFCAGTMIETSHGARKIEALRQGDHIRRDDGDFVPLQRIFQSDVSPKSLTLNPKLRPICITAGALGKDLPSRDLWVSRQHRMLVSSQIAERMFGVREILVPAIKLTALPGIFVDESLPEVTYFHLLFDRHEVIFAEGAPTESLFIGPEALRAVNPAARAEILALFPQVAHLDYVAEPARLIPTGKQQTQMVARHFKNNRPILN